ESAHQPRSNQSPGHLARMALAIAKKTGSTDPKWIMCSMKNRRQHTSRLRVSKASPASNGACLLNIKPRRVAIHNRARFLSDSVDHLVAEVGVQIVLLQQVEGPIPLG